MKMPQSSLRKSKTPAAAAISQRLEETIESSEYWARRMPREAVRLVRKERLYGVAAGGVSLLTGLLAWPLVAESSMLTAQVLISGLSGLAALAVAAPYASGLSDRGEDSIKLGSAYGEMHRELLRDREQIVEGLEKNASHLSGFYQQFDYIEERRDSLGIRSRPSRLSASGVPPAGEFAGREQAVPIAPGRCSRSSAPAEPVSSARTVVVDQDAVATLIYLVANQLTSQNQASTAEFARRPSSSQPEICEQGSTRRLEQHWQPALPFDTPRSPDSGRRDENRLTATSQAFLSKLSGPAGPLRRFSRS
ncbi:hypothetical protein ACFC18_40415 [Streptomyces sp. NPDC056121]|uniref:hypothetical protein n=2 Tax=Streptomyces TaxID=1883 RepID=UPI001D0BE52B|nr:hypothetical protein [Streptomyces longhuiensis]MCX5081549.1 hypothetical protein [Streptomyces sp. NBC_00401]UDL99718.1 hypothetical protein LGI35_16240 [Streptomyces longhuiensis]